VASSPRPPRGTANRATPSGAATGTVSRSPDRPRLITWPAGRLLWRVSRDPDGTAFSSSVARQNRFSPVFGPGGEVVAAWYGATTEAGAIFESVFHDIRPSDPAPRVLPNQYVNRILAPVVTTRDLVLVDLTSTGLHAIGIARRSIIESTSAAYPRTVAIAHRLRSAARDADGFAWVSRAQDTSQCVVLYADPGRAAMLAPSPDDVPLPLGIGGGLALLRELATAARITVIIPDR